MEQDESHLRERLARAERDLHHMDRWAREEIGSLKLRLHDLERDSLERDRLPSVSAGTKLLAALLIPLTVFLLTGSIEKALTAASAIGGH